MNIDCNEPVKYTGSETVNIDYHHGQLRPAVGASSVQVLRANREHPEEAEGTGWTYNHAPMLACRNGKLYLEYLSNPVEEHVAPGHTLLTLSADGINWSKPTVIFPPYRIPDGWFEYDGRKLPDNTYAVMHQRMGFYEAPNGKWFVLGNYGISPAREQVPFDRFSIGRVIREIREDDTFGPIYFIRYNVGTIWNESNTNYPHYTKSDDPALIEACEALLSNRLVTQQWAEEQGDEDALVTVKSKDGGAFYNKAFCWYKLKDGSVIGLWKWMKAAVSRDGGSTWSEVADTPTIKHSGAKIWGQKTADGNYALVYNPHTNNKHRWPLAVITGSDGLEFDRMMCVIGDVPPQRYAGGPFKGLGFNYVRGIETGEGRGPDDAMYVAYSMNKEDIWLSRVPVPIRDTVTEDVHDDFDRMPEGAWIQDWNVYSPKWAPVGICRAPGGSGNCLKLEDGDPYDYAKAERVFKEGRKVEAAFRLMAGQADHGELYVELSNAKGGVPVRVVWNSRGELVVTHGRSRKKFMSYEAWRWYDVKIWADARSISFDVEIDGASLSQNQQYQGQTTSMKGWFFAADALSLERIAFRTGPIRKKPDADNWEMTRDVPGAGDKIPAALFFIRRLDIVSE